MSILKRGVSISNDIKMLKMVRCSTFVFLRRRTEKIRAREIYTWCYMKNSESEHMHTATPGLDAPWCEVCNALLTWAIVYDEVAHESKMATLEDSDDE